jgi:molybdenum cofactor cytidylyltransferase
MGKPKLLLPYRGTTILSATVAAVMASRLDRVMVVTGAGADTMEASLAQRPSIAVVRNPDHRRGNMSSLLAATAADPRAGAFVLVPGDLPTISTDAIDSMIDLWEDEKPWAAVTEYQDRIAHPFLLSREAVDETAVMRGTKVLWRALVTTRDERVLRVAGTSDAPRDINTPEDYEALLRGTASTSE